MAIGMARKRKLVDGKLCFDTWIETGSVYKTAEILARTHGIVNPATGKPLSAMGIWQSAWTYALDHLPEGRKGVESVWRANGELLSDKDWYTLIISKARYIFGAKKFKKFMETNAYLKPYE